MLYGLAFVQSRSHFEQNRLDGLSVWWKFLAVIRSLILELLSLGHELLHFHLMVSVYP
jgi:hypothetical protein